MDRVLGSSAEVRSKKKTVFGAILSDAFYTQNTQTENALSVLKKIKTVGGSERYVDLMFYTPLPNDKLINRVVAWTTSQEEYAVSGERRCRQFAHVEISFPHRPDNVFFEEDMTMGFSIIQNKNVSFRLKSWRPEYTPVRMYIHPSTYDKLYQTCLLLDLQNIKFDLFAMYGAVFLPLHVLAVRSRQLHGTYCSKIITEVLQQFNIGGAAFMKLIPCQSTPSLLYKFVKTNPSFGLAASV